MESIGFPMISKHGSFNGKNQLIAPVETFRDSRQASRPLRFIALHGLCCSMQIFIVLDFHVNFNNFRRLHRFSNFGARIS